MTHSAGGLHTGADGSSSSTSLLPKKHSHPVTLDITALNLFEYCRCLKYVGKGLMLLIVGSLISLATYSVLGLAILPLARQSPGVYLVAVFYLGVIGMICWCYWRTMLDDPGVVTEYNPFGGQPERRGAPLSDDYQLDVSTRIHTDAAFRQHATQTYAETLRSDIAQAAKNQQAAKGQRLALAYAYETRPRWCKKCQTWKPPRSHHCSMMDVCVLKMDHYCVWMGNTIGLLNYKSFVLFLGWTCVGCLMSALLLLKPSVQFVRGETGALGPTASVGHVVDGILGFIAFVFTAAFTLALIGFLIMHWSLIIRNMTTIEAYEKRKVEPWPWDTGSWRDNAGQVFEGGPGARHWIRRLVPGVDTVDRVRLMHAHGCVKHTVGLVEFFERAGMLDIV